MMLIFPRRIYNKKNNAFGFTLIEVIIVIMIIASVSTIGINYFRPKKVNIGKVLNKISLLSRHLHNLSRIKKTTYRLAIKMDSKKEHSFWVESLPREILIDPNKEILSNVQFENINNKNKKESNDNNENNNNSEEKIVFKIDEKIIKLQVLPLSIKFENIEKKVKNSNNNKNNNIYYIYFFPQGLVEESLIVMSEKDKKKWSLYINPLTGHASIISEETSLEKLH